MIVNQGVSLHRVTVTGYTDKTGSEAHNLKLSEARASAVVQYLRDGGLHADQFVRAWFGQRRSGGVECDGRRPHAESPRRRPRVRRVSRDTHHLIV